jgi:putative membrane protein
MSIVTAILTGLVCLIHFYFMFLEMKLWEKKRIREIFGLTAEFAKQTRMMAFNQGLYNGFLAAGLLWSLVATDAALKMQLQIFFLTCVLVAGIVGAMTVTKRIFYIQGLPALLALLTLVFN